MGGRKEGRWVGGSEGGREGGWEGKRREEGRKVRMRGGRGKGKGGREVEGTMPCTCARTWELSFSELQSVRKVPRASMVIHTKHIHRTTDKKTRKFKDTKTDTVA